MSRARVHRVAAALAAVAALTACGSTVQSQATLSGSTLPGSGDALSAPGAPGSAAAPDGSLQGPGSAGPGSAVPGGATVPGAIGGDTGGDTSGPAQGGDGPAAKNGPSVLVGFHVVKDLGPATKALGVDGLSTGNGAAQARATADLINARGGMAGRRVIPVVFEHDATQNEQTQYQAACSRFFDDNKVSAVVSWGLPPELMTCAKNNGVPYVTSGNRAPPTGVLNAFPAAAVPSQMPLEAVIANQIDSLSRQGWFRPASRTERVTIGLLYTDTPDFRDVPARVEAHLDRLGLSLTERRAIPSTDDPSRVTAASAAGSNAVLRFSTRGVNRVLVVDKSGQAISYFGLAAQSQGYYPPFGISSLELPALLRTVLNSRQLAGTRGIGFAPVWDVPLQAQPPGNRNVRDCLNTMSRADEDMRSAATRASALTTCDGALALQAAWRTGDLTQAGFLTGLRGLGTGYAPVMTLSADFRRGPAPASAFRTLEFATSCDCFRYTGPARPVTG